MVTSTIKADPTIKDQLDTGAIHAMTINTKKA
jgi:hypothetical protein